MLTLINYNKNILSHNSCFALNPIFPIDNVKSHKPPAGTKHIIEDYHATVSYALNLIVGDADGNINASSIDNPDDGIPADVKLAFFNETRHAYGRTALLLSGGAYLGYYHMGVARALWYEGLFPRVISGASAGSLIAGMLGTRNDAEMEEVFSTDRLAFRPDHFCHSTQLKSSIARSLDRLLPRSIYWIGNRLLSIIFDGKLFNLDGEHFKRVVLSNIGPYTFQEAFDRTGRIINITVAPLNTFDPPRLLNYLTAPHVCVWSAAVASCALPGVFDSSPLIVKEPNGNFRPEHEWGRQGASGTAETEASSTAGGYSDGSLENDLPMQQLSELFNVNHFIVSQANPHSALLSSLSLRSFNSGGTSIYSGLVSYVRFLKAQLRSWLRNFVTFLNFGSDVSPWTVKRGIFQTITQDYEGRESDVTIMPWVGDLDVVTAFLSILKNPTIAEYRRVVAVAEANTWPFISRIRAHCQVEMTLDKCVQRLRKYMSSYRDQKRGMDRTPSFYTSRSIINLSGLSVADPIPATLHERPQGALSKKPSREFVRRHSVDNLRRISTNSSSNLNLYDFGSNAQERGSVGSSATGGMQKVGGGHDDFEPGYGHTSRSNSNDIDDLALTLSVRGADAELATESPQQMKRSRSKESNATNVSDKSESATTSPSHSFHSHNSREHIQEPAASGIHKTTSMANFYYKRSEKSNENLSNMK